MKAPAPEQPVISAQALGPPREDFAIAGPSTENGAHSMLPKPAAITPAQSQVCDRNSDQPSRRSPKNRCAARCA